MLAPWKYLPTELLPLIVSYFPYSVMRILCRTSNEMRVANCSSPTGSAHAIHLTVSRFQWRWITHSYPISSRCHPLGCDLTTPLGSTREQIFVLNTLRFHRLWTGPPIPYSNYTYNGCKYQAGVYYGGM